MKYISFIVRKAKHLFSDVISCEEFQGKSVKVIQMPIIDVCNSHCRMCNVWRNKEDSHITISDYEKILSDGLFKDVVSVGINGGEPTLRPDLSEIVLVLANKLKKLKSANIITNGIDAEIAFNALKKMNNLLKEHNIGFNVCVSLDGDELHHDRNRGVKGNYKSAVSLIKKLQDENVDVWVGCTLTKWNVYAGDDIVLFAEKNNLRYFEVRMAVDIKRLYNDGFFESQNFSKDERFHLIQFFQSMANKFSNNLFYHSLFRQLAYNKKRIAGCSWRHSGITLDANGNLSFCSVASPLIGNCLSEKPISLYQNNLKVRQSIMRNYCDRCMHDLNGPISLKTEMFLIKKNIKNILVERELKNIPQANKFEKIYEIKKIKKLQDSNVIIITGWWGTETHGDKAILGELINFLNKKCPLLKKIYLTCFPDMEYVVEKTIDELKETQICDVSKYLGTVPIINFHKSKEFIDADFIVIGGGPIERIRNLYYIERAFRNAIKEEKGTFIFGCGIDPVLTGFEPLVKSILMHTQYAFFRDKQSLRYANDLTQNQMNGFYACDPALNFVRNWKEKNVLSDETPKYKLCTLVRENTAEYLTDISHDEIIKQNKHSAKKIAGFISKVNGKIAFLSMNNLWIGRDDRIYNRRILNGINDKGNINCFEHKYMGLNELLNNISRSEISLVTRYHGHLFSFALNIPFLSIDYTGKGNKVNNLLRRAEYEDLSVKWDELTSDKFIEKFNHIDENNLKLKAKLDRYLLTLTSNLENVYEEFI